MIELSGFYGNQLIELLRYIEKDFIKLEKEDFSTLITRSNYDAFKDIIVLIN